MIAADVVMHPWTTGFDQAQMIFGHNERDILDKNQQGFTLKISIWNKQSDLVSMERTLVQWKSSVHHLGEYIVHSVGGNKVGDAT